MPHLQRALLALTATLGLVLSTLALASPANAGGPNAATLDLRAESGRAPLSGTLANGVGWSLDNGIAGGPAGALIGIGESQTVTFDRPVAGGLDQTVDAAALFSIDPAVEGRAEWRDPVTLRFIPERPRTPGELGRG